MTTEGEKVKGNLKKIYGEKMKTFSLFSLSLFLSLSLSIAQYQSKPRCRCARCTRSSATINAAVRSGNPFSCDTRHRSRNAAVIVSSSRFSTSSTDHRKFWMFWTHSKNETVTPPPLAYCFLGGGVGGEGRRGNVERK